MPTLLVWAGYRFLFYSREVGEPPHIHVLKDNKQLKIWLEDLRIAKSVGFRDHEVTEVLKKIKEQREKFLEAWHDHFGNQ
jgi:hypothetical protein